jgi:hypothetical protein
MTTIGYFGDSFCAGRETESWCVLLAKKLDARIVHWGEPGRSIWTTMMQFNRLKEQHRLPDICVFCWTEPYRLYHPKLILSANTQPLEGVDPNVYRALDDYWKYLHSYDKDELSYEYALRYYDQNILSKIKKEIIQMWSFKPFETAGKDARIRLQSGTFIDESMFAFSKTAGEKDGWGLGTINHMTVEQNAEWAEKVYRKHIVNE